MILRLALVLLWLALPAWAQTISPDGTTLLAGSTDSLTTADGVWTLGTQKNSRGNQILLNGTAATGNADKLVVAQGGNLYAHNLLNQWYQYVAPGWKFLANAPLLPGAPTILGFTASANQLVVQWLTDANTDKCTGDGNLNTGNAKDGMMSMVPPVGVTQFTITCTGPRGSASATVAVPK